MQGTRDRKQYFASYYQRRRQRAVEMLGGQCAKCGSVDDLEMDHIDPSTKSIPVGSLLTYAWATIELELSKCQLLCQACHSNKTTIERGHRPSAGVHGTVTQYGYGCRCDPCRLAQNERRRLKRRTQGEAQRSSSALLKRWLRVQIPSPAPEAPMSRDTRHWSEHETLLCGGCRRRLPTSMFHEDYYFVNRPPHERYGFCTDCRDLRAHKINYQEYRDRLGLGPIQVPASL